MAKIAPALEAKRTDSFLSIIMPFIFREIHATSRTDASALEKQLQVSPGSAPSVVFTSYYTSII